MLRAIRSIAVAALIIVATTAGSTITDTAPEFAPTSRFLVGKIVTDVPIPSQIPYEAIFNDELTHQLEGKKLIADASDPEAITVDTHIVEFTEGELADRFWWGNQNKGEAAATTVSTFTRHGASLGTITVRKTVRGGGLFSVGAAHDVIENSAGLMASRLDKLVKEHRAP